MICICRVSVCRVSVCRVYVVVLNFKMAFSIITHMIDENIILNYLKTFLLTFPGKYNCTMNW